MAGEDGRVIIKTLLDDSGLKKGLSNLSGTIKSGTKQAAKVVGASLGAATAAVGAFSVSSINDFIAFEDKMNEVFTLIPGASQEMKDSMLSDTKALAKEMGVLPENVVPALYQALSAGIPTDNVFEFLKVSSQVAKAGVASLDDSVGVLATVVNNYTDQGLGAEEATNMLFTAVKLGVTSLPELATNMGKVVPIASDLNVGFDEVSAAVAAMTGIMGKGSTPQAITNLRGMLNELGKEGSQASDAFVEVAGVGFRDFIAGGGTMQEAIGMLTEYANENNTSINNLFGSIEAGQAALILGSTGAEKFSVAIDEMQNSSGATQEAFDQMAGGAQFSIDRILANIDVLKLNFADQFAPSVDSLLTSVLGLFDGTEGASEDFANSLVDTLQSVFDGVIPLISELAPELVDGASVILESLVKGITNNSDQLGGAIADIIVSIVDFITANLPEITVAAIKIVLALGKGLVQALPQLGHSIKTMVVEMKDKFIEAVPEFIEAGKNIVSGLVQGIKDLAAKPVEAVKDAGKKMLDGIKGLFGIASPSKVFAQIGRYLMEGMVKGLNEMYPELLADSEGMVEALEAVWDDGEYKVPVPSNGGYSSSGSSSTPLVPQKSFGDIWGGITEGWDEARSELSSSITDWTSWASSKFVSLGNSFGNAIGLGVRSIAESLANQKETIKDLESSISDIQDKLTDAYDDLQDAQDDYSDAVLSGDKDAIKEAKKRVTQQEKLIKGLQKQETALKDEKKSVEDGSKAWSEFGKIVLGALADTLYGLGAELAARAALAAVTWNWAGAAVAAAGSAAAFGAAIAVDAWAGSFAEGGIVPQLPGVPSSGDHHVANVDPGELILNAAQQDRIASQLAMFARLTDMISSLQLSSRGGITINMAGATINGLNEEKGGRAIYRNIKGLQHEGVLKPW